MPIQNEFGVGRVETFPLPTDEKTLYHLLHDLFQSHWSDILFGILIQGAVFEISSDRAPEKISLFDGYLTVDFGQWHFHVCIGSHQGSPKNPTPRDVAKVRRCAKAEFYRFLNRDGGPRSWGLRLFNGANEQQLTVFLPNPFLTQKQKIRSSPDWSQLALWDQLRADYLGLPADPVDRSATRFQCGEGA